MRLENRVVEDDGGIAVEAGETHDAVDKCIYYVVEKTWGSTNELEIIIVKQ